MPIPTITAQVMSNKQLTPSIYQTTFKMIEPLVLDFKAGQHFIFEISGRAVRQYSIASAPQSREQFELCADVEPMGPGSVFIVGLKPGDVVKCRGPWGRFLLAEPGRPRKIFVATGVGITPLKSMILDLAARDIGCENVELYFGVRYDHDAFYFKEFEELAARWPKFKFYPTLSRPGAGWPGLKGRVTGHLAARDFDAASTEVYICGSGQAIEDVRQVLRTKGMPDSQVYFEKFFA